MPQAADESVLTPRFYTTDFDEMEQLFSLELNPNLPMEELEVRVVRGLRVPLLSQASNEERECAALRCIAWLCSR